MLMTLDIMMQEASGWWVLEKRKEDTQTAGIAVLVVTIVEDQRLVFALGASDYLGKPYDKRALIAKIHRLLPTLEGKRVLVVDDEANARSMIAKILKEEHAEVLGAASGDEAMAMIAISPPDLVLLDLMMPGMSSFELAVTGREAVAKATALRPGLILMDLSLPEMNGWEATRALKADPALAGIPVVAVTAHAMVGDKETAIAAGCAECVTKPYELDELIAVVERYIGRAQDQAKVA